MQMIVYQQDARAGGWVQTSMDLNLTFSLAVQARQLAYCLPGLVSPPIKWGHNSTSRTGNISSLLIENHSFVPYYESHGLLLLLIF